MRNGICLLLLVGILAACEKSVDPATGQSQTLWTVPFTTANTNRSEAQWQQCIKFRSESHCARNLPGGRPPGAGGASSDDNGEMIERPSDP